jgi:hypothetical protein
MVCGSLFFCGDTLELAFINKLGGIINFGVFTYLPLHSDKAKPKFNQPPQRPPPFYGQYKSLLSIIGLVYLGWPFLFFFKLGESFKVPHLEWHSVFYLTRQL